MYSAPGYIVHDSDFVYGTNIHTHPIHMPVKYIASMHDLAGIVVFGKYMGITWEM